MSTAYHPYAPVKERGSMRAFLMAVVMHLMLGLVLYLGVQWQIRSPAGAEAELWEAIPPTPTRQPAPEPPPPPIVRETPPPAVPKADESADIALREQKRRQAEEAERRAEQLRRDEAKRLEQQKQDDARKQRQREADQREAELQKKKTAEQQAKLREERLKAEQAEKADKAEKAKVEREKLAKEKAAKEAVAKDKAAKEAKAQEAAAEARKSELARLRALAATAGGTSVGGSGGGQGEGSGSDTKASPGYADRVRAKVKPNIVFDPDAVNGNPSAVVAVKLAPDGSILSKRLARSSGDSAWDNAVLRAVDRSDPLPRDTNGKAPGSFNITFRPKD